MTKQKKKTPVKLFIAAFVIMAAVMVYQNLSRQKIVTLLVKDNKGTSFLETVGDRLVCIFQDGQTCIWDWSSPHAGQGEFAAVSERAIVLDAERLAAVAKDGKKVLTVYAMPSGQKQKELAVGWDDQVVWPRISFDKKAAALVRASPAKSGTALYEFLTLDIDKDTTGLPVSLSIQEKKEALVDFAVDSSHVLYAAGSKDKTGRIAAFDLKNGKVLWDRSYENAKEFCSIIASPDSRTLLAGSRDGMLYKINTADGQIAKNIVLLEAGETRAITNDYSVLNLAFSPDKTYYVATINPVAYILRADSDTLIHKLSPADKLVSKIAFSPDGQQIATSDIRASYPVKIWPMKESQ